MALVINGNQNDLVINDNQKDKLVIYDPVHGEIVLKRYVYRILDTPEFQRLRNLKQLGLTYIKFPSATHTRFEHCVGVCYLIQKFLEVLEKNSNPRKISEFNKQCVMIAGLLHDVGHGPFSHMWDEVIKEINGEIFEHEDVSCKIARNILEKHEIKDIFEEHEQQKAIKLIQGLIKGEHTELCNEDKYLAEIVNNKFCELDLDKLDYLQRDAYYLKYAVELNLDITSWFNSAKIITMQNGTTHIAYDANFRTSIANLFDNRGRLHEYCYQNDLVIGAELTLCSILKEAELAGFRLQNVKISEAHEDGNLEDIYNILDDSILNLILVSNESNYLKQAKSRLRDFKIRKFPRLSNGTSSKLYKKRSENGFDYMKEKSEDMKLYKQDEIFSWGDHQNDQ